MPNQRSDRMVPVTVTLPRELIEGARALPSTRLATFSAIVRQALAEFVNREECHDSHSEH